MLMPSLPQHYHYCDTIRDHTALRHSFNALSQSTFDLDFEPWFQQGYWQTDYRPHTILYDNTVVANVSLSLIHTKYQGVPKCYGQIGTVMTHPDHRHKGLADALMQKVLTQYRTQCDALYLYANDSVLDFYPKYGFVPAKEYQHEPPHLAFTPSAKRRLDLKKPQDIALLHQYFHQGNPFAELPLLQNWGLLMFYCSQWFNECVYYLEDLGVVAIGHPETEGYVLYDVFGQTQASLNTIMSAMLNSGDQKTAMKLGFSPKVSDGLTVSPYIEEDCTLFVYSALDNPFAQKPLMMPLLSRA